MSPGSNQDPTPPTLRRVSEDYRPAHALEPNAFDSGGLDPGVTSYPAPLAYPGAAARAVRAVEADDARDDAGDEEAVRELAHRFGVGDEDALADCYRRWSSLVYSIALRSLREARDAEDVTQQVFFTAWRSRADFDPDRGSLPAWLIGITKHRVLDQLRARSREQRILDKASAQWDATPDDDSAASTIDRLISRMIMSAELEALPHPRGMIVRMSLWEDRTYAQIADQLELPLGTVKSHARRGLLQLRARIEVLAPWTI